jgi:hypothetical protein
MVSALRRHDFLLDETQKLLALRQGYAQSRDVTGITSTLRFEPSDPISTRRNTNFILIPQPLKHTAGHSLPSTPPPFF